MQVLSILTQEEGPCLLTQQVRKKERKKGKEKLSSLNMEFGSERSGHEVKDEKRSESSVGDEEDRREQEIVTQVKIISMLISNIKHTMMSF